MIQRGGVVRRLFLVAFQATFLIVAVNGLTRNITDQAGWLGLLGFVVALLPDVLRWRGRLVLPFVYEATLLLFVFASLTAGEYFDLYGKFSWWDDTLHFVSGLVVGYLGLLTLYIDDKKKKVVSTPRFAVLFVISLVLASAITWEIFEFLVDQFAHGHMQYGLVDTMVDTIDAAGGAAVVAIVAFLYYKKLYGKRLQRMFDTFLRLNPRVVK